MASTAYNSLLPDVLLRKKLGRKPIPNSITDQLSILAQNQFSTKRPAESLLKGKVGKKKKHFA